MAALPEGFEVPPRTRFDALLELAALAGLVAGWVIPAVTWGGLPERVPTHFNAAGSPDGWGPKGMIVLLPAVSTLLYLLITWAGGQSHMFNVPVEVTRDNAAAQINLARRLLIGIKAYVTCLFAFILWMQCRSALGEAQGLGPAFLPVMFGVLAAIIGLYFLQVQRNR